MSRKILIIGSSNTDFIANVDRFPAAGETISGKSFLQAMGGKGANQTIAAHRSGGDVTFATCLGDDANGHGALKYFKQEGLDVSKVRLIPNVPTGNAMIFVNAEGENCIVITAGANKELSPDDVQKLEPEIEGAFMVVLQMEIPIATVEHACKLARKHQVRIMLNVAPARIINSDLISLIDLLLVNEPEIEMVSGQSIETNGVEGVMNTLLSMGAKTVILTLGKKGCVVKNALLFKQIPAFEVDAIDTTAAGDTFCGALAAQLSKGKELLEALKFATAASAICVTRVGAQPSIPKEAEVIQFMRKYDA